MSQIPEKFRRMPKEVEEALKEARKPPPEFKLGKPARRRVIAIE